MHGCIILPHCVYIWCPLWPCCELLTYFFNTTSAKGLGINVNISADANYCILLFSLFLTHAFSLYQLISFPLSSPVWGLDLSPHLWIPAALLWRLSDGRTARFCISHKTQQNLPFLLCLEKTASCSFALVFCTRNRQRSVLNTSMQFSASYLISPPQDLRNNQRYGCEMHAGFTIHWTCNENSVHHRI